MTGLLRHSASDVTLALNARPVVHTAALALVVVPLLGAGAAMALPPHFWLALLVPSFSGLLWVLNRTRSIRAGIAIGWLFGFGHFVTSLSWVGESFTIDAARYGGYAVPAIVLLCGFLALFPALTALLFVLARPARGYAGVFVLAAAWTVAEWLRATVLSGFPWNAIGYVWTATDQTIQTVSVIGIHGLGFWTVVLAALPGLAFATENVGWRRRALPLLLPIAGVATLWLYGSVRLSEAASTVVPDIRLRIVQASIPQALKWLPAERERILARFVDLSSGAGPAPTHIVWPESAVPFLMTDAPAGPHMVASWLSDDQVLLTGADRLDAGTGRLFNSLMALGAGGRTLMTYDKVHLVPFGEFMPLRSLIPFKKLTQGSVDFSEGEERGPSAVPGLPPFSPLICYEAIFQNHGNDGRSRPDWLLNVTNDAWFGLSDGPYQHFQMARVRAVEQGVPLIRAANTGISAVVDAYGRILQQLPLGASGVIDAALPARIETPTWFPALGNGPVLALAILCLGGAFTARLARGRRMDSIREVRST